MTKDVTYRGGFCYVTKLKVVDGALSVVFQEYTFDQISSVMQVPDTSYLLFGGATAPYSPD